MKKIRTWDIAEFEALVEKAKAVTQKSCGGPSRSWIEVVGYGYYGKSEFPTKLFILQGSPPKGYVLVDYGYRVVRAFGCNLAAIRTYYQDGWKPELKPEPTMRRIIRTDQDVERK